MSRVLPFLKIVISLSLISSFGIGADFELNKILSDAKKVNKQTMLFLHKDNCNFCDNMVFNLEDKNVSSTIEKNFILVDINRDDDETISFQDYEGTNREFLKKLGIDLYPTVLFIDNNNSLVYDVVGYRNKKLFINILNYVGSKAYINKTFEEFEDELLTDDDDW
jgi:thioredoxin-related protein